MHGSLADANQSTAFDGIFSFQYLFSQFGNDPEQMSSELESALRTYLESYFPEGAKVTVIEQDPGSKVQYILEMSAAVISGGETYTLHEALYIDPASDLYKLLDEIP